MVIPSRGESPAFVECLLSLTRQTLAPSDYEILVVDDASESEFEGLPSSARLVRLTEWRGPGGARNEGVRLALAPVVAFTDDDCVVPSDWLDTLLDALERYSEAVSVGGYLRPNDRAIAESPAARLELHGVKRNGSFDPESIQQSGLAPAWGTANLAWRKKQFIEIGGFEEGISAGEDRDLALRAGALDWQAVSLRLAVEHHRTYSWSDLWRQWFTRGLRTRDSGAWPTRTRAIVRLPIAFIRRLSLVKGGDLGLLLAGLYVDVAFSVGLLLSTRFGPTPGAR